MLLSCNDVAVPGRVEAFSAHICAGEVVHLVGPNGAGKSTLLMVLAGLQVHLGTIIFSGIRLEKWTPAALAKSRAWLSQQQWRPDNMSVWYYLDLHLSGCPEPQYETEILYFYRELQIEALLSYSISRLSGGEWQRVRLAGIFTQLMQATGKLLLLDEPMSALDLTHQQALDRCLRRMTQKGIAVVVSSHDINHTLHNASTVWLINKGTVIENGEPRLVLTPEQLTAVFGVNFRLLEQEQRQWILPCD
ncbi:MAG: Vitamin B12 import ATP-binding protein BtuD [Candidatus Erwinia impunctatus]|nr:Vitamin B12 import ATP-binding protein BtuD [Culicoides impunctatus]